MSSPIALYGSLLSGLPSGERPKIEGLLELTSPCIIPGQLYDLGSYPGLVESKTDFVRGELYKLLDPQTLQILDWFERYDPQSPDDSLYHRQLIFLKQPPLQAWVYVFNGSITDRKYIAGGDWKAYLQDRKELP